MNEELKKLAEAYAKSLVEWHSLRKHCQTSELREDHVKLRLAIDAMNDAQYALDEACRKEAESQ